MTLAKLSPRASATTGMTNISAMNSENSGYQSCENRNWNFSRAGSIGTSLGEYLSSSITSERDHWNSWVTRSAKVRGPSPEAMASMAWTPRQPNAFIISVVEWSSASSGPRPPICFRAAVRTA